MSSRPRSPGRVTLFGRLPPVRKCAEPVVDFSDGGTARRIATLGVILRSRGSRPGTRGPAAGARQCNSWPAPGCLILADFWRPRRWRTSGNSDCSFQGTAFLLRIDPLERLNRRSRADPEIWIVAEALERFVERHGACAEVAERAPATAVRGVEQHDLVAVAGQA